MLDFGEFRDEGFRECNNRICWLSEHFPLWTAGDDVDDGGVALDFVCLGCGRCGCAMMVGDGCEQVAILMLS